MDKKVFGQKNGGIFFPHFLCFKVDFGLFDGKLLLADEFTPDGCRLWDTVTLA